MMVETRAPYITRLSMSRPWMSVPNGYSHVPPDMKTGGMPLARRLPRTGSWGESIGARRAQVTSSTSMTTGTTGYRRMNPQNTYQ